MDIEYLLFLQSFRDSIHDALTPFMEWISLFGITNILLLPVFVYWCLDKRKGLFILTAWNISMTVNALVKLVACVYRPWVRDARVLPAGDSVRTATGYSFPSGHTMMATPVYGGFALFSKRCWSRLFWIAAILLTGFSRNYLGVHTPQDVLVGFILGGLSIYATVRLFDYLDRHPERENRILGIIFIIGVLILVYVTYKPYPMDYVDGKLLVDPTRAKQDAWVNIGGLLSLTAAWYMEKRWVKFSHVGCKNVKGVIFCVLGLLPLCWILNSFGALAIGWFGPYCGRLALQIVVSFYVMVFWPLVLKGVTRPGTTARSAA
ncbi:MAG: phosphatase PAP2 family protein [Fretibacterium sp.]|nr:phosphatase PAP2 family protein [Fretibacterium sp.]